MNANILVYTATRWDQIANETNMLGEGHGLFTMAVTEGMRGKAKTAEGEVRAEPLHDFLRAQVAGYIRAVNEKIEALVHFLASTGSPRQERPMPKYIAAGRDLYHKVGCVACHGTRNGTGEQERVLPTSVPLGDVKAKYTLSSLAAFLEQPHVVRPGGRMPKILANGQEALLHLRQAAPPNLIVLDLMMPVMNGLEFREQQTQDPALQSIPVLVISADGAVSQKAAALGAKDFLLKPIDLDKLVEAVERCC